jgi:Asp-tRNA(Asn)/Glu-tRNA(Gln) amidotransferase A subunit family amidase
METPVALRRAARVAGIVLTAALAAARAFTAEGAGVFIKAYNGTCVQEPDGLLGRVETIKRAGQINALSTLNLRPAARAEWGFDARKARSLTDAGDADPALPDALELAARLDASFAATGKLTGPLHGVVIAINDQFDTVDMRTTSGAAAPYASDRPLDDSTFVRKLREAGAIIIAKANMGEYAGGDRSSFGGTFCNPYDTERSPGRSSGGSGSAVAANLVMCAIAEESGPSARNPGKNNSAWTLLGANGFPAITVPAGFTAHVYDRVPDEGAKARTKLAGPVEARLPVGVDFLARPFDEPTLLKIAAAYEAATHQRVPPPDFGPLPSAASE